MKYSQSLGYIWNDDGSIIFKGGWSGNGKGKNNPEMEGVKNKGPIPRGRYIIGTPYDSTRVGKFSIPLIPSCHNALDRTHLRMHGATIDESRRGEESDGCVILPFDIRKKVFDSNDKIFDVIE